MSALVTCALAALIMSNTDSGNNGERACAPARTGARVACVVRGKNCFHASCEHSGRFSSCCVDSLPASGYEATAEAALAQAESCVAGVSSRREYVESGTGCRFPHSI